MRSGGAILGPVNRAVPALYNSQGTSHRDVNFYFTNLNKRYKNREIMTPYVILTFFSGFFFIFPKCPKWMASYNNKSVK